MPKEELVKLKHIKELYTDSIIHSKLMTFEGAIFKELLDKAIYAYESAEESHYGVSTFITLKEMHQLKTFIERIKGE